MNLNKLSIIVLLLLSFCACHNNEDDSDVTNHERAVTISVKYKDQNGVHIDGDARIYIYYGIYSADLANYNYSSEGVFTFREQKIVPDIKIQAKGEENISTVLESTKKITILVESSFLDRKALESYSPGSMPIKSTFIFGE